ncbi:MAG TPA: glutamine synthetase family protein [Stellaceae bacterium]|nr:glutamine synthetase family protein [Stellaceae bacterium]
MEREPLIFVGTCDLAGLVRGKGFAQTELSQRLREGVGLAPSNIMMSPFGPILDTPYGTEGDLMLVPDASTFVEVEFDGGAAERFYLGDITNIVGQFWACCPRDFLRRALETLEREARLTVVAAFEQEFTYTGVEHRPGATYSLDAWRRQDSFGEHLTAALRTAGLAPDTFLPEYGPRQYEMTVSPARGIRAADEAVIARELARSVAYRLGHRAIFAPILDPDGIGNGTHIHFSLRDTAEKPVLYNPDRPWRIAREGEAFVAGILDNMPLLTAITTPSPPSYFRLRPDRWAPTWSNIGLQDRGASLRVCPIFGPPAAHNFNLEYRVADATASPYLALGALVWAGLDGIRRKLTLPPESERSFWEMSDAERREAGAKPLPRSLDESLGLLAESKTARDWFGDELFDCYVRFKRAELHAVEGLSPADICAKYAEIY